MCVESVSSRKKPLYKLKINDLPDMSNPMTGTSEAWAQLVANIGPLLVLVGEKHVKAYFKTMHKPSHHLLFAASPIGVVTAVTTLIRLGGAPFLKRLIGRQFEPWAQVLLDVTSVSCGEVGLELIGESLEQSINPSPDNVALFWIKGGMSGTPDQVTEWTKGLLRFAYDHFLGPKVVMKMKRAYSCYERCDGLATVSVVRVGGSGAVWIAREKALDLWVAGGRLEDHRPGCPREREAVVGGLKVRCRAELAETCPNIENTTCEAIGFAIGHLTGVSHVLTGSENQDNWQFNASCYAIALLSVCCNVGILVAIGLTRDQDPRAVGKAISVGAGLLFTSVGSWHTARLVDRASDETITDLSCFGGTAAGFVSRSNPQGVELGHCPKRLVTSVGEREHNRVQAPKRFATDFAVCLMVCGFLGLYLGLRSSPWWASLGVLCITALTSCARSMFDSQVMLKRRDEDAIPYIDCLSRRDTHSLLFQTEKVRDSATTCSVTSDVTDPFVVSDSYEIVQSPIVCLNNSRSWRMFNNLESRDLILLALNLAHEMRVQSIAPFELSRPDQVDNPAGLVFLHSDLFASGCVARQPMEVLVAPYKENSANGIGTTIFETIVAAIYGVTTRFSSLRCRQLGDVDNLPGLKLRDLRDHTALDGKVLKEIALSSDPVSGKACNELVWVAAKIIYVIMLNMTEETMIEMGKQWFKTPGRSWGGNEIRGFLRSMQSLKLVVERSDPADSGGQPHHSPSPTSPTTPRPTSPTTPRPASLQHPSPTSGSPPPT